MILKIFNFLFFRNKMSNEKKITIEKREFKIKNGEKFILEYPSNFEEIANKKLLQLQQDYDKSISNNINPNNNQSKNINKDINYYQQIGEIENINTENNKEIKLEPQEGFIEIKPKKIDNINNNKKNEIKDDKSDEEINSDEFYEVEEKNIKVNQNINTNNKKDEIKRNISPVKDPDNVKLSMKKLNFKTPKWAEKMTDEDFINMAKNKIKK